MLKNSKLELLTSAIIISELVDPTTAAVPVNLSSSTALSSLCFSTVFSYWKITHLPPHFCLEKVLTTLCSVALSPRTHVTPKFLNVSFHQYTTLKVWKLSIIVKFWRNFTNTIKSRNNNFKWTSEKLIIIRKNWENIQHFERRSGAESTEKIIKKYPTDFV